MNAPRRPAPLRILTAVPLCDGHDAAVTTINIELARHGFEVVYLGYHCAASAIARAAVQEDVHAVGISSYNGGHVVFFQEVMRRLKARGGGDIAVFGGGGGTITSADERIMRRSGVRRIFFAGTPIEEMMQRIKSDCARGLKREAGTSGDRALARAITLAERAMEPNTAAIRRVRPKKAALEYRGECSVVGVAGPGGVGKSTLIDELAARFLRERPEGRLAILANDPTQPGSGGAILGDRVSAIHAQNDRVFFRSLATRGSTSGLSPTAPAAIEILRRSGRFDLILVESIGIGQEGDPFHVFAGARLVDVVVFVLAPHYGGRIQLQKISLLPAADFVALNKCDQPAFHAARAEVAARLEVGGGNGRLFCTIAARHADTGTDELYRAIIGNSDGRGEMIERGRRRSSPSR